MVKVQPHSLGGGTSYLGNSLLGASLSHMSSTITKDTNQSMMSEATEIFSAIADEINCIETATPKSPHVERIVRGIRFMDAGLYHFSLAALVLQNCLLILRLSMNGAQVEESMFYGIEIFCSAVLSLVLLGEWLIRLSLQEEFFHRSKVNSFHGLIIILIVSTVGLRAMDEFFFVELDETSLLLLGHLILMTQLTFIRPMARNYSKQLEETFSRPRVAIASQKLRNCIESMPYATSRERLLLQNQLNIVSPTPTDYVSGEALLEFFQRALVHKPVAMTSTELVVYLRDSGLQNDLFVYTTKHVLKSTLQHWTKQKKNFVSHFGHWAAVPLLQSYFLRILTDGAIDEGNEHDLIVGIVGLVGLSLPFFISNILVGHFQAKTIASTIESLQKQLMRAVLFADSHFFKLHSESDLASVFNGDLQRVNALWQAVFWNLINPVAHIAFTLGYVFSQNWQTASIAVLFVVMLLMCGPEELASEYSKSYVVENAVLTAEFQCGVTCQRLLRAYGTQDMYMKRFHKQSAQLRKATWISQLWATMLQTYFTGSMFLFVGILVGTLAYSAYKEEITKGTFISLSQLFVIMSGPVTTLGGFLRWAIGNAGSLQRVDLLLQDTKGLQGISSIRKRKEPHTKTMSGPVVLPGGVPGSHDGIARVIGGHHHNSRPTESAWEPLKRGIVLKNLSFSYSTHNVDDQAQLCDLSLEIHAGSLTCICGPSGSGKSTLLGILMGAEKPSRGSILFDDVRPHLTSGKYVYSNVSVVFQDAMTLNGTILENIQYGKPGATYEECLEAAAMAEVDEFVSTLPEKYDTRLGSGMALNISGGQAQRISLARALCRKPSILILDEATSALDLEVERAIVLSLKREVRKTGLTVILVTHRLHTCMDMDDIIVMDQGKVVQHGVYETLSESPGLFRKLLRGSAAL